MCSSPVSRMKELSHMTYDHIREKKYALNDLCHDVYRLVGNIPFVTWIGSFDDFSGDDTVPVHHYYFGCIDNGRFYTDPDVLLSAIGKAFQGIGTLIPTFNSGAMYAKPVYLTKKEIDARTNHGLSEWYWDAEKIPVVQITFREERDIEVDADGFGIIPEIQPGHPIPGHVTIELHHTQEDSHEYIASIEKACPIQLSAFLIQRLCEKPDGHYRILWDKEAASKDDFSKERAQTVTVKWF